MCDFTDGYRRVPCSSVTLKSIEFSQPSVPFLQRGHNFECLWCVSGVTNFEFCVCVCVSHRARMRICGEKILFSVIILLFFSFFCFCDVCVRAIFLFERAHLHTGLMRFLYLSSERALDQAHTMIRNHCRRACTMIERTRYIRFCVCV